MWSIGSRTRSARCGAMWVRRKRAHLRLTKVKAAPRAPERSPMRRVGTKRRMLMSIGSETKNSIAERGPLAWSCPQGGA